MILRLILKQNERYITKDITFYFTGTPDNYNCDPLTQAMVQEIVEAEVVGVQVIAEDSDYAK